MNAQDEYNELEQKMIEAFGYKETERIRQLALSVLKDKKEQL